MQPLELRAGCIKEIVIRVPRRVETPVSFAFGIENFTGRNAFVNIAAENKVVWPLFVPTHRRLNSAVKPTEFGKRRHEDAPPYGRLAPSELDREIGELFEKSRVQFGQRRGGRRYFGLTTAPNGVLSAKTLVGDPPSGKFQTPMPRSALKTTAPIMRPPWIQNWAWA